MQVTDLLTQIQSKNLHSKDAAKDQASIASDIRSLASEVDSILKTTKFNDQNLLAQSDGSALASNPVFDVMGDINMDFAGSSYLDADSIKNVLTGGASSTPGVKSYQGATISGDDLINDDVIMHIKVTTMDGQEYIFNQNPLSPFVASNTREEVLTYITDVFNGADIVFTRTQESAVPNLWNLKVEHAANAFGGDDPDKYIKSIEITDSAPAPFDIQGWLGIESGELSTSTPGSGGLLAPTDADVINQAGNLEETVNKVKSALGRIGNLTQQVQMRSDFLTSSIANSESSVSRLFDADMAQEQLIATKNSIGGQAATQILAQANTNPQQLLQLFR